MACHGSSIDFPQYSWKERIVNWWQHLKAIHRCGECHRFSWKTLPTIYDSCKSCDTNGELSKERRREDELYEDQIFDHRFMRVRD